MPSPLISSAVASAVAAYPILIRSFFVSYRDDTVAGNWSLLEHVSLASITAQATINALPADAAHDGPLRTALSEKASNVAGLIFSLTANFSRTEALANLTTLNAAVAALRTVLIAQAANDDPLIVASPAQFFGDGSDGNVTITASNTTISGLMTSGALTRDAYFNNLTISGAGRINTGAFRIFVRGVLDLRNAQQNAINRNGNNGANAASATGAAAATAVASGTLGGAGASGAAGNGTTTAGAGGATSGNQTCNGGSALDGGAGGLGASGAGGTGGNGGTQTLLGPLRIYERNILRGAALINGGQTAGSGGGGGGDGTNSGGGGGAAGTGGGIVWIAANFVLRSTSTESGCIAANAGTSGNGFTPATGNCGGGGGGSGAGGGWVILYYGVLLGPPVTNFISTNGGTGGNGGSGVGTGVAGTGGAGGRGGRIGACRVPDFIWNTALGTVNNAASGSTGGAGEQLGLSI